MKKKCLSLYACCLSFILITGSLSCLATPAVMLATIYPQDVAEFSVEDYWVSEKLDGVRARWDGQQLLSKNGYKFAAPAWFTEQFPNVVMDGELWMQRQSYEKISSITSQHTPHNGWSKIKLMLFDLPEQGGTFSERVSAMQQLVATVDSNYLAMIPQFRLVDSQQLMQRLNQVVEAGGEGLMLHHQAAHYVHGRSDALLKLKLYQDAEATVIAYKPGKGKFSGMLGSIKVRDDQGREFYVGSGFSHQQRHQPPPLHSRITYRYQGRTRYGLPRFPVFLRVRNEK